MRSRVLRLAGTMLGSNVDIEAVHVEVLTGWWLRVGAGVATARRGGCADRGF
jgi:hypothetical protein